jgi:hypothetical protein
MNTGCHVQLSCLFEFARRVMIRARMSGGQDVCPYKYLVPGTTYRKSLQAPSAPVVRYSNWSAPVWHTWILSHASSGVHSPQSTVHSPQSTVHSPQSTVHSPQSTVHSPQSTVHSPQSTVHLPKCTAPRNLQTADEVDNIVAYCTHFCKNHLTELEPYYDWRMQVYMGCWILGTLLFFWLLVWNKQNIIVPHWLL